LVPAATHSRAAGAPDNQEPITDPPSDGFAVANTCDAAAIPGILLIIMREGDRRLPPASNVVPAMLLCLAALLLLGMLLTNRSLRTRWSNRSRFTAREWLTLIVTILLGVALGHILYMWVYPDFALR